MFSIFDGDHLLGDTGTRRVVVLRGTTTVSQLFSPNFFDIEDWAKTALQSHGFDVVNVRMSAAGYIGYSNNLEIELNVDTAYSAEQARQNAIVAIEAYTANWGLNKVFSNTTLSVASDAMASGSGIGGSIGSGGSRTNGDGSTNPPSVYDRTTDAPSSGDFLSNLGLGLGVSTPVVLLGGGVLLLLLLKK